MNTILSDKLKHYRDLLKLEYESYEPEKYETEINSLSRELIDIMENELINDMKIPVPESDKFIGQNRKSN